MSDTNFTSLGFVEETTFGTTPSANLQLLRRTGGNLTPRRATTQSEEIRSDLRTAESVETGQHVEGSIDVEWSYGTFDDMLEGVLMNAFSSNVLIDGTTKKSYTFEDQFEDPSISPFQYLIYKGCRIQELTLDLALDSIVTGSLSVMGKEPSVAQASVGTGDTAATTTSPYNTVDMVTTLTEGPESGTEADLTRVVGVDLSISRALRQQRELGSVTPWGIGTGRLSVEGTIQQHFEDATLLDAWFAFSDRSLTIELDDNADVAGGNQILINIPKVQYTGDPDITIPGPDDDVLVSVDFTAYADSADPHMIQVTRTPA